jgi:putative ABC transport system permease protein
MTRFRIFVSRLFPWMGRRWNDADLGDEIHAHLDLLTDEHLRRGVPLKEARAAARRDFGGVDQMKERYRDQRGLPMLDALLIDLRHAFRVARKNPGFAAIAIFTLAIGIGANTALFSVVNAVLLRPLPYANADRLLSLNARTPARPVSLLGYQEYRLLREQSASLENVALWLTQSVNLTGSSAPERIAGNFVTGSFFDTLGLRAERGRLFTETEAEPGRAAPVVVISHTFWQRRFSGLESVLDQGINLNGTTFTVIGVLAQPFDPAVAPGGGGGLTQNDVFIPAGLFPGRNDPASPGPSLLGIARMRAGVALAAVNADLEVVSSRIRASLPDFARGRTLVVTPLQESIVGNSRTSLLLLLGAVGAVLLIACVNVSNLLLARSVDRQKEIAMRVALGAGRVAIVRQMCGEAVLLTVISAALGVTLGRVSLRALTWLGSSNMLIPSVTGGGISNVPIPADIPLDPTVLVFSIGVSVVVAFLCALLPAVRAARVDPSGALQAGGRGGTSDGRRVREGLVVAELALSIALVAISGLLLRSLLAVEQAPLGFQPDHVFTLQFRLPPAKYQTRQDIARFFRDSIERVRAVPGVESAALVRAVPLSGNGSETPIVVEGRPVANGSEPVARYHFVTPGYFRTMKIRLQRGRDFADTDDLASPYVAIVNQTLARSIWPGADPVGKRLKTADIPDWLTVIGVVDDAKHSSPTELPRAQLYVAHYQNPQIFSSMVARTSQAPMSVLNDVRNAFWSIDKDQPLWATTSLQTIVDGARAPWRFMATLVTLFALIAVAIASAGVYGVMSYSVSQRRKEIGIRLALGAEAGTVRRELLAHALLLAGIAVVGGFALAVSGARFASSVLVGVQPTDAASLAGAGVVLALVAMAACYAPARRASRVDPLVVLREE